MEFNNLSIPIVLASTSPRRIFLMSQVNLTVEVQAPQVDERPKSRETPRRLVFRLAKEKAESVRDIVSQRYETSLILAADTIVVSPNGTQILGKPKDPADAKRILKSLAGKTHIVLTGYCLLKVDKKKKDQKIVKVVQSKVKIRPLTPGMIDRYVATGEPMDKAGAYGAQGLGMALVERIEGSYTNVVGLPMTQILVDLEKTFKISLFSWRK